jgi:hypothetical protein
MSFVFSHCMYFLCSLIPFTFLLFKLDSQRPIIHLVMLSAEAI